MDELIKLVVEKTGMPEEQAKAAVETVLTFLKQKLPAPIAAQVEAALTGEGAVEQAAQVVEQGLGHLGGLLGKR